MRRLFYPENIVVVGVSTRETNLGRYIVGNLIEFGFKGGIHLLGRSEGYLYGHKIHTDVREIEDGIDFGVFLVPARTVPGIFEELAKKGMKRAVIQSGGFRELGEEGAELEKRLADVAEKYGIRFVGPNCLGIMNKHANLAVPFVPFKDLWKKGGVSVASQSGGVGVTYLYRLVSENIGLSKFASIGNKLDIDETDYLEYFSEDPDTDIIVMYLESIGDGRHFFEVLRDSKKPVIIQKANKTQASQRIAYSHTAAMTSNDDIIDAAINQAGGFRVQDLDDAFALIKALMLPAPKNNKAAIIARSGGHAVVAADSAAENGFEMPDYPQEFLESIKAGFDNNVIKRQNPLDLGDVYDFTTYADVMEKACQIPDIGVVFMIQEYFAALEAPHSRMLVDKAKELTNKYHIPVVLVLSTDEEELAYVKAHYDYPIFTSIPQAFNALARVRDNKKSNALINKENLDKKFKKSNPIRVFDMLKEAGLDVPEYCVTKSIEEIEGCGDLKFPVVAKVMSNRIVHKTEHGAVRVGIGTKEELDRVVKGFFERFQLNKDMGEGVLIQRQLSGVVEAIVGGINDAAFGPVISVGVGGTMVELIKDIRFLIAPVTPEEVMKELGKLKTFPLFKGYRGKSEADVDAFVRFVSEVSVIFSNTEGLEEFEFNPVFVMPEGEGIKIIDARFKWKG